MASLEVRLKGFFEIADFKDKNGFIGEYPLYNTLKKLGPRDDWADFVKWFDKIDRNKDKEVTLDDIMAAFGKLTAKDLPECESDLLFFFMAMDKDGQGQVDKEEVTLRMRERAKAKGLNISEDVINRVFDRIDVDNSGTVSFAEFVQGYRASQRRHTLRPELHN